MERDLHSTLRAETALTQQTISTATTTNGAVIDTLGFEGVDFVIQTGVVTAAGTSVTAQIWESDVNTFGGEQTQVVDPELRGSALINDNADDNKCFRIGSVGKKRYQRLSLVSVGTPNLIVGAVAILGFPVREPTAEQNT